MIIDAKTFNDLKDRVMAECNRRCYTGSLEAYGDPSWYSPPYDASNG